ncbi:MAG TPA: hypothetical protein VF169_08160 [Albitalea sp.]|uniref:hypothetical protein n=1 Tax=Piscinibacter sp. TaxID=1903157 RepID=UPI002ED2A00B
MELVAQGSDVPVFFVRSGSHAYVLIGSIEEPGAREEDLVVLDLWPRFPMAHTLKDARQKFPLIGEHEEPAAYAARLEQSNWTMCGWRPGQTDFLDGCDVSGQAIMNSHGVRFDDAGEADETGSDAGLHDWDAEVLLEGSLEPMVHETNSADKQPRLAQFDPEQYLSSRLGGEDPLRALLPKIWNEWLFSTEHASRSYVAEPQAEPVSFNEYRQDRWDAWQDAIAQLRIQDSQTGIAVSTQEAFLDVPRGYATAT